MKKLMLIVLMAILMALPVQAKTLRMVTGQTVKVRVRGKKYNPKKCRSKNKKIVRVTKKGLRAVAPGKTIVRIRGRKIKVIVTQPQTQPQTETERQTEQQIQPQTERQTEANVERSVTPSKAVPETVPIVTEEIVEEENRAPETEPETVPVVRQTETERQTKRQIETETETETETESETETETEEETEMQTECQPDITISGTSKVVFTVPTANTINAEHLGDGHYAFPDSKAPYVLIDVSGQQVTVSKCLLAGTFDILIDDVLARVTIETVHSNYMKLSEGILPSQTAAWEAALKALQCRRSGAQNVRFVNDAGAEQFVWGYPVGRSRGGWTVKWEMEGETFESRFN